MSGFDFDIYDVANLLRLKVRHKNSISLDVDCPFCGRAKKLNINRKKNVYHCNYCDEHGGMLQLYSSLYSVSLSEANQQIREALNKGQYKNDYDKVAVTEAIQNSELASIKEIDHTYSTMLSMLSLAPKNRQDLLNRGLTIEQIEEQRYRSVPVFGIKKIVAELEAKGCTIEGVPGFYLDKDGRWTINFTSRNSGILIPIISLEGCIQGFQIRLDHPTENRKYIWLSSINYQKGVSSGGPIHIVGNQEAGVINITEGALKGTIAHYLTGDTYICVPGVSQYRNVKPILEALKKKGLKYAIEAYDMDKKMKVDCDYHFKECPKCKEINAATCPYKLQKRNNIQKGCKKVYEICQELNLPMKRIIWDIDAQGNWNGTIKGIDDYYYDLKMKP